jgi:hypothetical protein
MVGTIFPVARPPYSTFLHSCEGYSLKISTSSGKIEKETIVPEILMLTVQTT